LNHEWARMGTNGHEWSGVLNHEWTRMGTNGRGDLDYEWTRMGANGGGPWNAVFT